MHKCVCVCVSLPQNFLSFMQTLVYSPNVNSLTLTVNFPLWDIFPFQPLFLHATSHSQYEPETQITAYLVNLIFTCWTLSQNLINAEKTSIHVNIEYQPSTASIWKENIVLYSEIQHPCTEGKDFSCYFKANGKTHIDFRGDRISCWLIRCFLSF